MNIFLKEHKTLIFQLLDAKVEFILVGGYAVIASSLQLPLIGIAVGVPRCFLLPLGHR